MQRAGLDPKFSLSIYGGGGTVDGKRGDHALLAPMYNTTKEEIETIARLTTAVVEHVFSEVNAELK